MVRYSWIAPVLFALSSLGCGGTQELNAENAGQESLEQVGEARQALVRYCTSDLECNSACECDLTIGQCKPDGFGPPPEGDYCSLPPQRACTTSANCRSGCSCTGGFCRDSGGNFSNTCAKPPPDSYEADNSSQTAQGYLGSPQTGHTFHDVGDADWVVVYVASAMQVTFETYNLVGGADPKMELYAYNASTGAAGSLLATNDNRCPFDWPYDMTCLNSRIVRSVPAQSAFFIRIQNMSVGSHNLYNQTAPGYSLRIF